MKALHCDDDDRFADWVAPELVPLDLDAMSDEDVGRELAYLLSSISEDTWCAGWLAGIEEFGWHVASGEVVVPVPFGMGEVDEAACDALERLRQRLRGGWVAWVDDGVYLLTADEWATRDQWRQP